MRPKLVNSGKSVILKRLCSAARLQTQRCCIFAGATVRCAHGSRVLLPRRGGAARTRWQDDAEPARALAAHRARPAPTVPARAAPRAAASRHADRRGVGLPQRLRAARPGALAPRARLRRGAAVRGTRARLPPRRRLHVVRQRARIPLPSPRARARRRAAHHGLQRPGAPPGAARALCRMPEQRVIQGLLLAAGSAVLGGALALAARRRPTLLEMTRTFAFTAAMGVVAFHLLPEVLPALGPPSLL